MQSPHDWVKSSFSSVSGECVEVRMGDRVGMRDSKNPTGTVLDFPREVWEDFIGAIKSDSVTR
ncbi:hypothetical protein Aple_088370 [Acrocarpospora pleiomorpha]|uniref:DUF397 domain-containing protein n=1 Tax=Acrocarpospora pleiomorpha TaxID=90975 RepID=A0A5M3Y4L9_9ACTN|nr:DUF397 domain-containing protein [Acrocarpospora pleiomorpha]GES25938.1 hypothetical protein Aple_088370 [Acrocarpospora pleiomorpha]